MSNTRNLLLDAIKKGELDEVKRILSNPGNPPDFINKNYENAANDGDSLTALHSACLNGKEEIVEYLLTQGADSNIKSDKDNYTSLHYLAVSKTEDQSVLKNIAFLLLQNESCDMNEKTKQGDTFLLLACRYNPELAIEFISKINNEDFEKNYKNIQDNEGRNYLYKAAISGNTKLIELCINLGIDVNQPDNEGNTPIFACIYMNKAKAVKFLFENGANLNVINKKLASPIDYLKYMSKSSDHYEEMRNIFENNNIIIPATHGEIINLCVELGYLSLWDEIKNKLHDKFTFLSVGLCYGLSIQALIDCQDGRPGLKKLNDRLNIIGKYSPQELKNKIDAAKTIRREVHNEARKNRHNHYKEKEVYNEKEKIDYADAVFSEQENLTLSEAEKIAIIKKAIKSEFNPFTLKQEEQDRLINYFLKNRETNFQNNDDSIILYDDTEGNINDEVIRKKMDEIKENYLIQREEQIETDKRLKLLNKKYPNEGPFFLKLTILCN